MLILVVVPHIHFTFVQQVAQLLLIAVDGIVGFMELTFMFTLLHIHVTFSGDITRSNDIVNELARLILDGHHT